VDAELSLDKTTLKKVDWRTAIQASGNKVYGAGSSSKMIVINGDKYADCTLGGCSGFRQQFKVGDW